MVGYDAYRRTQGATATQNARDLEYRLLAQVTGSLMDAESGKGRLQDRLNAILRNEKVWNAFLADLNHPDNGLSQSLKGSLASLALWVVRETKHVIENDASLEDLIVINRQIMAGLKPEPMAMVG